VDFYFDDGRKYFVGIDDRGYENSNYTYKITFEKNHRIDKY
jgi:hypothetical protein